jgi:hypothetical protein
MRNVMKMYGGEGAVVPSIHMEKYGYSVNTCDVFRKSQVPLPVRTLTLLIHLAVSSVSPCRCPVLPDGHFLSHSFPFIIIRAFEATQPHLVTASYNTLRARHTLFY